MTEKNGKEVRGLIWAALMCSAFMAACIFVSERGDASVDEKCKLRYTSVEQTLRQIQKTLDEVHVDVKTHIKEDR